MAPFGFIKTPVTVPGFFQLAGAINRLAPFAPRALAGGERPRISLLLPQPCDRVLRDVIGEVVTFGEMLILETNSVG